ncbi:transketolase [bacterium]|nr:transketolase [bacterium]
MQIPQLQAAAQRMRAYNILAIHCAGSGHPGGTLSIMDVTAALYCHVMRHDPAKPDWPERDRCVWSTGHKAPALYVALAQTGYCKMDDVVTGLRQFGSPFEGHPNGLKLQGVEVSTGSLGQGLGYCVGQALALKGRGSDARMFCMMGDGEQQEGSVWEAAMSAGHFKLDNLVAIIDVNGLQIDGPTKDVMNVEPLDRKYEAFGWKVMKIDGHDMQQIVDTFDQARAVKGQPVCILVATHKGKGVSFMEDKAGWHGIATTSREQLDQALADIGEPELTKEKVDQLLKQSADVKAKATRHCAGLMPKFSRDYWWNAQPGTMQVKMEPTRFGFGKAIERIGDDPRIVTLHADISGSIKIADFEAKHPERKNRVFSVGIAEQNMVSVACGLAREGLIPVGGTYGVFACGRNWDQWRTTACYGNLNVKMAGAHGGISVGRDGATHQALEEISILSILPNMHISVPCDSIETDKATEEIILKVTGPGYVRYAREGTPVVTRPDTPYKWGVANIIRFRGAQPEFPDAFETIPASDYAGENEDVAIIACGPAVAEAMRAAWILKEEAGLETRVINLHTVKPLDRDAIIAAMRQVGSVMTVEEHQTGGLGGLVAQVAACEKELDTPFKLDMIGIDDRFGQSADPWELMQYFGLTAEHIAKRAVKLIEKPSMAK